VVNAFPRRCSSVVPHCSGAEARNAKQVLSAKPVNKIKIFIRALQLSRKYTNKMSRKVSELIDKIRAVCSLEKVEHRKTSKREKAKMLAGTWR